MIRVLVCANSPVELTRLEAMVNSSRSLKLVGRNLGRAGLDQQLQETQPDILLERVSSEDVEKLSLPDLGPTALARVWLVNDPDFNAVLDAIRTGHTSLRGVLPYWASQREVQTSIEAVAAGLLVFHPDVVEHFTSPSTALPRTSNMSYGQQLSPRESEILNMLAAGQGNKEIAWRLKISEHTAKFHVTSIFNKLNVSSRAEAVAVGMRLGLIIL